MALAAGVAAGCGSDTPAASTNPSDHPPAFVAVRDQLACPGGARAARVGGLPGRGRQETREDACPYRAAQSIGRVAEGVMRQPEAIAIAPSGRVYVADQYSYKVQIFSPSGVFEGQWGAYGSGPGQFGAVGGLAIDADGNVYLLDCAHDRVEELTARGRFIRAWGSTGTGAGQLRLGAGSGPSEPPGGGIAVGARYVYVADTRNNRIVRYNLDGSDPHVIATAGSGPGHVMRPKGLAVASARGERRAAAVRQAPEAVSAQESLYVADNGNGRVEELTAEGRFIAQARSFPATPSTFQNAYDVSVAGGAVYVVDDNHGRIVKFTRSLRFLAAFGGHGALALSPFPRAVAADNAGHVYVADAHYDDVELFTAAGTAERRFGISANDPGQFVAPVDIALGPHRLSLVVETFGGLVHLRSLHPLLGRLIWAGGGDVFLGSLWFGPTAAAFAPDGTVWVTDPQNNSVRHLTTGGRFLAAAGNPRGAGAPPSPSRAGWAAPSEPGATGGPVRYADLSSPEGIAVDASGRVLVTDHGAAALYRLAPNAAPLSAWRSSTQHGQSGLARARVHTPGAVALGPEGSIYVADPDAALVARLSGANGSLLAAWGGHGRRPGRFGRPTGIAVDGAGHVFVADGSLDRIQEFTAAGRALAAWGRPGSGAGELSDPGGIAIDCEGDLLVADTGNNRVQVFVHAASPSRSLPCAR